MEKLGINLGFFIFQVLNFSVVAVLLYAWAYKPIVKMLEERKNKVAQGLEDARVAAEARENAEEEAKNILAEAQTNANQVVSEATQRAEEAAKQVKASAEQDLEKQRNAAMIEAELERDRMLADVRGQIAALAVAASQKLIGEALTEERQHALINEFFSGVEGGKVVALEGVSVSGAAADVTSAVPLTNKEQDVVKARLGEQVSVSFRVDPSILGGLVIRVGDKVLDNSVASSLEELRQSLH
ncbi:MAG: F0F1 ATP synthase subunit B [Chloroflexi bacterium]|jgi:F-type H+-transporting ATPase subunit b|nr:F0F1 ATP synthase subunit B [Chloroflexota bacterium]